MGSGEIKKTRFGLSQQHWVSDPGGEPSARHIAHDSAAFQFPETVGFHSRTSGSYLNDHGSDISGLNTEPAFLFHLTSDSSTRFALRLHY